MSGFTVDFEFDIGDLVFTKGSQHTEGNRPRLFCISERIAQQCHGGIQKLYKLETIDGWHAEVVLTKDEPPYRPMSDARMIEHFAIMEQERKARESHWGDRLGKSTKEAKAEYRKNHPETENE